MADSIDMAQAHADELLARNIASVVNRPEQRRRAVRSVTRCVSCQDMAERYSR